MKDNKNCHYFCCFKPGKCKVINDWCIISFKMSFERF